MATLHSSPCVLNSFLHQFPQLLISHGGDLSTMCRAAGLSVVEVTGPTQLIAFDRFIDLLELAARELGMEDFAMQLASRQNLQALGPVSMKLSRCQDFPEAIETIIKYLGLLVSGITMQARLEEESWIVEIDTSLPVLQDRPQFQDYLVASTVMVLRELQGSRFALRSCQLYQADPGPAKRRALTDYLGCMPTFGQRPICLRLDTSLMQAPLNVQTTQSMPLSLDIQAARKNLEQSVTDAVLYFMLMGKPNIGQVAPLLGYSPRTLRRRLNELSLSFSNILDAARMAQANRYLQSTHYRLGDIANLLGLANQSAFTRSYLRCSGMTPSEYKLTLQRSQATLS